MAQKKKKTTAEPTEKNDIISWRAAEFEFKEKTMEWYATIAVVAFVLLLFALWQKNFFFAIFTLLAGTFAALSGKRRPSVIDFSVSERGVNVGAKQYPFDQFSNFAVRTRTGHLDEIVLFQTNPISINPRLPIDAETLKSARMFFKNKLEEVDYQESLIDLIAERFGF